ncbi:MAG: ABC transporter ATP-binding protein [bacterium]
MLELININKSIKGKDILKNVSFSINEGEILGFIGPNGAGKTSTIRVILQLYTNYSGQVKYYNQEINQALKYQIGFMLDSDGLYDNLTLFENLNFYADIYKIDFKSVINENNILLSDLDLIDVMFNKISTFSRGMRQKVSFVKSILHKPKLLILDEPFTGLDPDMQVVMRDTLLQLNKRGTTILFSSHNLYEVERLCNKIAIIKDGQIKLFESIQNLRNIDITKEFNLEKIYFDSVKIGDLNA